MGSFVGPNIVEDGLVFAVDAGSDRSYPGSGTTTTNIINGANGTLTNGVAYVSNNGGAFDFDGTDDFILFPDDTNLNNQTLTMESWVNMDSSLAQDAFFFEKGLVNTQYSIFANSSNIIFRTIGLSTQDLTVSMTPYTSANTWFHVICTYGAGVKKTYINGAFVTEMTGLTGTIPANTNGPRIGAHSSGYYLNGEIAVSRVYNKALTSAEALQNYNAQKTRFI
tara:strand:+ start:82 stop:750 length:669 start_codon:yes stop_codon:yes gene_type:complete